MSKHLPLEAHFGEFQTHLLRAMIIQAKSLDRNLFFVWTTIAPRLIKTVNHHLLSKCSWVWWEFPWNLLDFRMPFRKTTPSIFGEKYIVSFNDMSYHIPALQGILVHLNVVIDVDRISYFDKVLDMFYFSLFTLHSTHSWLMVSALRPYRLYSLNGFIYM